jgi:UDP-sulfoquinovose synthase
VENRQLLELGLTPITLAEGLLEEVTEIARKFSYRADLAKIPARSMWRQKR